MSLCSYLYELKSTFYFPTVILNILIQRAFFLLLMANELSISNSCHRNRYDSFFLTCKLPNAFFASVVPSPIKREESLKNNALCNVQKLNVINFT